MLFIRCGTSVPNFESKDPLNVCENVESHQKEDSNHDDNPLRCNYNRF